MIEITSMSKRRIAFMYLLFCFIFLKADVATAQIFNTKDWAKRGGSAHPPNLATNIVIKMKTDKHGNIYALTTNAGVINIDGHTAAPDSNGQYSLTSWDCTGNFRWMKTIRFETTTAVINDLAVDTLEGIYFTGKAHVNDTMHFDSDTALMQPMSALFMIKYNSAGAFQWMRVPRVNTMTPASDTSESLGLSVSQSGDVYWFTYLNPGTYAGGAFMLATDLYGVLQYNASGMFQNFIPLSMHSAYAAKNDDFYFSRNANSGNMYVSGSFSPNSLGSLSFGTTPVLSIGSQSSPGYIAAFSNAGNNLWVKQGSPDKIFSIVGPTIDHDGNLYILGNAQSGNVFNGDTAVNPQAANMYVGMPFVMAMDSNGHKLWTSQAAAKQLIFINDIEFRNNHLIAAGEFNDTLWWDNNMLPMPANGNTNIFLVNFDAATGTVTDMDTINGHSSEITIDKNSNVYVGGSFSPYLSFGGSTISALYPPDHDWFVAKYKNVACNCHLLQPEFSYTSSAGGQSYNLNYNGDMPYTSISWSFGDGATTSGIVNPYHLYTAIGNYPICVTVTNGCGSNSICHWVGINTTGVNDFLSEERISVYPNPGSEQINISNATAGMILDIYNLQGQKFESYVLQGTDDNIKTNSLAPGVYLLLFKDKNGNQKTVRLIKQ